MLDQEQWRFVYAVLAGFIGSFIGFWVWPCLRQKWIWLRMSVRSQPFAGVGGIWCRVVNGSGNTMGKAVAYLTIIHERSDVLPKPARMEKTPYLTPQSHETLEEGQLCWGVQESGVNPMRIDIYAGESQPLAFGSLESEGVEIFSEQCRKPARVLLQRKKYTGTLNVVCADCSARTFYFELDPDNTTPIRFIG